MITITSRLIWAGRTSMKVRICVESENLKSGERKLTNTAFFTYVALDDEGRPVPVPRLCPQTPQEQKPSTGNSGNTRRKGAPCPEGF